MIEVRLIDTCDFLSIRIFTNFETFYVIHANYTYSGAAVRRIIFMKTFKVHLFVFLCYNDMLDQTMCGRL